MVEECNICCEINGYTSNNQIDKYNDLVKTGKNIIFKDKYFTLIPSIGPLNYGHIMIIPNKHILSFHFLNKDERIHLNIIKDIVRKYNIYKFNSKTEFFEHGTGIDKNYCGSCISHAHLHSIPVNSSINRFLVNLNMQRNTEDAIYSKNANISNGYLFLEDINEIVWFNNTDIYPSQILRKYYSIYIFNNENWDWRVHPNFNMLFNVIDNYNSFEAFFLAHKLIKNDNIND